MINDKGLHAKMENLEAILKVEACRGVSELTFLCLVTYHQRVLPDASTVLASLYEIVRAKRTGKGATPSRRPSKK